jgi:hypothetical protein
MELVMGDGLKRAKAVAKRSREADDFLAMARKISALSDDLGDDITTEDVRRNPELGRLLLACDDISGRMRRDARDWLKSQ